MFGNNTTSWLHYRPLPSPSRSQQPCIRLCFVSLAMHYHTSQRKFGQFFSQPSPIVSSPTSASISGILFLPPEPRLPETGHIVQPLLPFQTQPQNNNSVLKNFGLSQDEIYGAPLLNTATRTTMHNVGQRQRDTVSFLAGRCPERNGTTPNKCGQNHLTNFHLTRYYLWPIFHPGKLLRPKLQAQGIKTHRGDIVGMVLVNENFIN